MSEILLSAIIILLGGWLGGQLLKRVGAPPLLGAILVGIALGQFGAIAPPVLERADVVRTLAVTIVLVKAGLGLDVQKLRQQGSVAVRLGLLPGACEAVVIAAAAVFLLGFDWGTGLLLGCVIGAESPAVIVPGMLRMKALGWGVTKGIPDAMLTGSAISDAMLLLVFSLLLNLLSGGDGTVAIGSWQVSGIQALPFQVVGQVLIGGLVGIAIAWALVQVLGKQRLSQSVVLDLLVATCVSLGCVVFAHIWPYFSGYLAVMAMGVCVVEWDAVLARRLRGGFNSLWLVAEIALFVLMGATVDLHVLESQLGVGLAVLAIGLLLGRTVGWWLSTVGSDWTWKEKLFLLPGNSAKATVQAAIGAVPLAAGIEGGETILAIAVLSILVTAPLGAWGIEIFAPRLLEKGIVDPSKVAISGGTRTVAAVDDSPVAAEVLMRAADIARRTDGVVTVLHVASAQEADLVSQKRLQELTAKVLVDVQHRWVVVEGPSAAEAIVQLAMEWQATDVVMGQRGARQRLVLGSVSEAVLEECDLPVSLVALETRPSL